MDKATFLKTTVSNCKNCGNKIRPSLYLEQDMGASYNCPEIKCVYCDIRAGKYLYYPGDYEKCIQDWEKLNG